MEGAVGDGPEDVRAEVDAFCSGSRPAQNGLEERLDMIAAQLSVIAYELHRISDERPD